MIDQATGMLTALRWELPVHTPSDEGTQDRMECLTIATMLETAGRNAPDIERISHLVQLSSGEIADPDASFAGTPALDAVRSAELERDLCSPLLSAGPVNDAPFHHPPSPSASWREGKPITGEHGQAALIDAEQMGRRAAGL